MLLSDRLRHKPEAADVTVGTADDDVTRASNAFLHGRFAAHLRADQRPVPPWALLNQVAHGRLADLRAAAADDAGSPTEASLARAVVARAHDEQALAELQERILVPLEHCLSEEIVSPRRILELATAKLFD